MMPLPLPEIPLLLTLACVAGAVCCVEAALQRRESREVREAEEQRVTDVAERPALFPERPYYVVDARGAFVSQAYLDFEGAKAFWRRLYWERYEYSVVQREDCR